MSTLFTPMAERMRGFEMASNLRGANVPGTRSIQFQGDAGWGVMTDAAHARLEKARENRAGKYALPGVLR